MVTYADLLDHVLAYLGTDAGAGATATHRAAVQNAYRILPSRHTWGYLWVIGRVLTNGGYSTGTVAFDLTGGAVERQLTLTDGTWPSWAADGYVTIANVPYTVQARVSDTVLQLEERSAPAADVASGTTYQLLRDSYPLPSDFIGCDEVVINEVGTVLQYQHPRTWAGQRRTQTGPGQPWTFTLTGDAGTPDRMMMNFWPPPDNNYAVDVLYRRKLRPLVYERVDAGAVTVSANSTTVTGAGTAWKSGMVGSVIRLAADNTASPTGPGGGAPAAVERTVTAVASATSLTVGEAIPDAYAGVLSVVSDPVDLDYAVMLDYLLREVEYQARIQSRMKPTPTEGGDYQMALTRAMEADNRSTGRAAALRNQTRRSGFIHYPINFTGG